MIKLIPKNKQQILSFFNNKCIENKPIPFPDYKNRYNY
jgi:hypothetical protein